MQIDRPSIYRCTLEHIPILEINEPEEAIVTASSYNTNGPNC